jgi:hypothetical protein
MQRVAARKLNSRFNEMPRDREAVFDIRAASLRGAKRRRNPSFLASCWMDCFASLARTAERGPRTRSSSPAKAGDPVFRRSPRMNREAAAYWIARSSRVGYSQNTGTFGSLASSGLHRGAMTGHSATLQGIPADAGAGEPPAKLGAPLAGTHGRGMPAASVQVNTTAGSRALFRRPPECSASSDAQAST